MVLVDFNLFSLEEDSEVALESMATMVVMGLSLIIQSLT